MNSGLIKIFIISIFMSQLVFMMGCAKTDDTKTYVDISQFSNEKAVEDAESVMDSNKDVGELTEVSGIKTIDVGFYNDLSADIGMISLIDPVTGEQANIKSLKNKEYVEISANMPTDNCKLQWAIYNINGDLYTDSVSDLSEAKKSAWIILSGNKKIDKIDVKIDLSEEEIDNIKNGK